MLHVQFFRPALQCALEIWLRPIRICHLKTSHTFPTLFKTSHTFQNESHFSKTSHTSHTFPKRVTLFQNESHFPKRVTLSKTSHTFPKRVTLPKLFKTYILLVQVFVQGDWCTGIEFGFQPQTP